MRYDDWDVLLFPKGCGVPLKEFKVSCEVVEDAEFGQAQGSFGLPTISCFVPSLVAGEPFQVSMHSWSVPVVSQTTKSYTKYHSNVKLEARLFVDGVLVASACLDRKGDWPHILAHSFELDKNGDLEALKFPPCRQEVFEHAFWSPADDLGRIKLVISEGFPRNSPTVPVERVKNLVAFSFQHAPLDILEKSGISWPNPQMWRRTPRCSTLAVPAFPSTEVNSHAHSPRGKANTIRARQKHCIPGPNAAMIFKNKENSAGSNVSSSNSTDGSLVDPFADSNAYFDWLANREPETGEIPERSVLQQITLPQKMVETSAVPRASRKTSTDVSMQDYLSTFSAEPSSLGGGTPFTVMSFQQEDEGQTRSLKAPTNTPIINRHAMCDADDVHFPIMSHSNTMGTELATSLAGSFLQQPVSGPLRTPTISRPTLDVRSRKENRADNKLIDPSLSAFPVAFEGRQDVRKVSQNLVVPSGATVPVPVCQGSHQYLQDKPDGVSPHRIGSLGSFGNILPSQEVDLAAAVGTGRLSEKGTKRARNITVGSPKAAEDGDEPGRESPRVRLTPFTDENSSGPANQNSQLSI